MKSRCEQTTCSWIGGWRYCIFSAYAIFYWSFFCWSWTCFFLENTCKFCIFIFAIRCCIFSAYYDMFYWSWVDLFCNLHAYSAYLQYMEDTGRSKMRQKNWSFRGFRTKYLGLECPSGIFPRYSLRQCKCWLNGMVTSKKRHYTQTLLHLSNIL